MTDKLVFERKIWKQFFLGYEECVRIVPQSSHDLGAERQKIQYPLTKFIADGGLSKYSLFSSFNKGRVLILNNLKLAIPDALRDKKGWSSTNKRPDMIVFTNEGEVLVIECKQKNDKNIDRAVKAFITLKYFADNYAVKIKTGSLTRPLDKWRYYYDEKYLNKGFDDFNTTLAKLFSFKLYNERAEWAEKVRINIKNNNIHYGFAINDTKNLYDFDSYKYSIKDFFVGNNLDLIKSVMVEYNSVEPLIFIVDADENFFKILNVS